MELRRNTPSSAPRPSSSGSSALPLLDLVDIDCCSCAAVVELHHSLVSIGQRVSMALGGAWEIASTAVPKRNKNKIKSQRLFSSPNTSNVRRAASYSVPHKMKDDEGLIDSHSLSPPRNEVPISSLQLRYAHESLAHCVSRIGSDARTSYDSWIRRSARILLNFGLIDGEEVGSHHSQNLATELLSPSPGSLDRSGGDNLSDVSNAVRRSNLRESKGNNPSIRDEESNYDGESKFGGDASVVTDAVGGGEKLLKGFHETCLLLKKYWPRELFSEESTESALVTSVLHGTLAWAVRRYVLALRVGEGHTRDVIHSKYSMGTSLEDILDTLCNSIRDGLWEKQYHQQQQHLLSDTKEGSHIASSDVGTTSALDINPIQNSGGEIFTRGFDDVTTTGSVLESLSAPSFIASATDGDLQSVRTPSLSTRPDSASFSSAWDILRALDEQIESIEGLQRVHRNDDESAKVWKHLFMKILEAIGAYDKDNFWKLSYGSSDAYKKICLIRDVQLKKKARELEMVAHYFQRLKSGGILITAVSEPADLKPSRALIMTRKRNFRQGLTKLGKVWIHISLRHAFRKLEELVIDAASNFTRILPRGEARMSGFIRPATVHSPGSPYDAASPGGLARALRPDDANVIGTRLELDTSEKEARECDGIEDSAHKEDVSIVSRSLAMSKPAEDSLSLVTNPPLVREDSLDYRADDHSLSSVAQSESDRDANGRGGDSFHTPSPFNKIGDKRSLTTHSSFVVQSLPHPRSALRQNKSFYGTVPGRTPPDPDSVGKQTVEDNGTSASKLAIDCTLAKSLPPEPPVASPSVVRFAAENIYHHLEDVEGPEMDDGPDEEDHQLTERPEHVLLQLNEVSLTTLELLSA